MKKLLGIISIFAISLICVSCSDEQEEYYSNGKHVLPFTVNIVDEETIRTRLIFEGAKTTNTGQARNLKWEENDHVAFYSKDFPAGKKKLEYLTHVEGDVVSMYGEEGLPFDANKTYTIQSLYPYERLIGTNGLTIQAELPSVQNGTVNIVKSGDTKKGSFKECPKGQEEVTNFNSKNVTDYSCCLLYAEATNVQTNASKEPKSKISLNYRVLVQGIDVIIDAPKSGSATISQIDFQVGSTYNNNFTPSTSTYLTGTIEGTSPNVTNIPSLVDNKSNKIELKFDATELVGSDRMVARMYAMRKADLLKGAVKITVHCSLKDNNGRSQDKTFYRLFNIVSNTDNVITHFYLGQIPTPEYDYVDLGLPSGTLWATKNLGASDEESAGDYYAWASPDKNTSPYTFNNYMNLPTEAASNYKLAWKNNGSNQYRNPNSEGVSGFYKNYSIPLNNDIAGTGFDAAFRAYQGKWKMPSKDEFDELISKCTWEWIDAKKCFKITSNVAGYTDKFIYLPASGYYDNETNSGMTIHYWTSLLQETGAPNEKSEAYALICENPTEASPTISTSLFKRYYGLPIRPVRKK